MARGLGLEDVYGATLGRIQAQGGERSRLGMAALMWICYSERPLKVDELCHALAVEIGSTDFDLDNVPSIRTVLSVQNVNARGTIYSMWIILRKCEGGCEARLVRSREQIW